MTTALIPAGDAAIEGVVMMDRREAEEAERKILANIEGLREQIAAFDDAQGWAALGWESFRAWASSRIPDANLRYLYRLRDANQVDKLLGAPVGATPESHAREAKGVPPERVPDVFQRADQIAQDEGRDRQARDVAAAKQQVLGGMPAAPKLKAGHEAPITPEVLIIGARTSYYAPPPLIRESVQYATPNTLRTPAGTRQKHQAYCLPDDAAFERIAAAVAAFGAALSSLANTLRAIGRYADHLEQAGGMKDAPNPLCPTVAKIQDPDRDHTGWYLSEWYVPRLARQTIARHTPKMLSEYDADYPSAYVFTQDSCFVLPNDLAWDLVSAKHAAVNEAMSHVDTVLQELGLYSIAQADKRYTNLAQRTATAEPASKPAPASAPSYVAPVLPRGHVETEDDDAIDPELHEENWSADDAASPAALNLARRLMATLPVPYQRALAAAVSIEWIDVDTLLDQEPAGLIADATEQLAIALHALHGERSNSWLADLINNPALPAPAAVDTPVAGSLFALNDTALREVEESTTLWSEPERLEFAEIRAYAATMVMIIRRGTADDHDRDIVRRLRRRMEDLAEIDDIDDDAWEQLNRDLGEIDAIMGQMDAMTQPEEITDGR